MSEREQKEQELCTAIDECILLSDEDKQFWIKHASVLPNTVLDEVIKRVSAKNNAVKEYLGAALEDDPDHKYLSELKEKIRKIKEKAYSIEEGSEKGNPEETMEQQLKNL
jgi:hypothetical protein